jgi:hypothetical protein
MAISRSRPEVSNWLAGAAIDPGEAIVQGLVRGAIPRG